jgi:long-subunit acyl-CoA synthetase (AMP-forming)
MRALIFGIGGQDGSYMAELLIKKGYDVYGTNRRSSVDNLIRIKDAQVFSILQADLTDAQSVYRAISLGAKDYLLKPFNAPNLLIKLRNLLKAETIKKFVILPGEFTVESGELTPSLKVRRGFINTRYASELDSLYAAAP